MWKRRAASGAAEAISCAPFLAPATAVTSATSANPVQRENSLPGTPGWEIPADAGTDISGYASEISVAPGLSVHLHVTAPAGSRYRVLLYRLGWYRGIGGRLIMYVPGCRSSHAATAQSRPTTADSVTGLFQPPWRVTDRVEIPRDAVSGYYEARSQPAGGRARQSGASRPDSSSSTSRFDDPAHDRHCAGGR